MQSFEYANPGTVQEAVALLSAKWGETDVLAGGTDLLALMKENLHTPKRVVNLKNIKELEGISKTDAGFLQTDMSRHAPKTFLTDRPYSIHYRIGEATFVLNCFSKCQSK